MTSTLEGAIHDVVSAVGSVPGILYAPNQPVERISSWPAAMTYATDGTVSPNRASQENKTLHTINIAVLMPLNDMVQASKTMVPFWEPISNAIIEQLNSRESTNYATWSEMIYTLGPIEWPTGELMYGYILTLGGVKIINELGA